MGDGESLRRFHPSRHRRLRRPANFCREAMPSPTYDGHVSWDCRTVECQACFKGHASRPCVSRALAFRTTGGGGDANAAAALAAAEKRGRCSTRRRRTCAGSSTSTTPSASPGPTPAPGTVVSCRPCSLSRLELGIPNLILGALDFNTKAGAAPPVWLAGRPAGRRSKVETKQF